MSKHKFTVMLLRPDYMADNYGTDFTIEHVETQEHDAQAAVQTAQALRWKADNADEGEDRAGDPEDYFVLAVFDGHLQSHYTGD